MLGSTTTANGLLVLGITLLVAPTLFPLQPVLYHDTRPGTSSTRAELEERGYDVVAFENLSERGQTLYLRTLRAGGEYRVPVGTGAPDFAYPTPGELDEPEGYRRRSDRHSIVIERPNDSDLPPADEPLVFAEHRREPPGERDDRSGGEPADRQTRDPGTETGPTVEERRRQIVRYDVMATRTDGPPLTARSSLLRLVSAVVGVLCLATGGYSRSTP